MSASTSTRTPSRPNTVPDRALASTRADITPICVSVSASSRRLLWRNRRLDRGRYWRRGTRTRTAHLPPLQLAQCDQALDQEEQDQQPNDNSLIAAGCGGQDAIDDVQAGGDRQCQQRPAHGEISEAHQDRTLDYEHLWQDLDPAQCSDETEQHRQAADDVESEVGVPIPAPQLRIVKRLRHRDPPLSPMIGL